MRCDKCGAENPDSKRFCGDCGAALTAAGAQGEVAHPPAPGAIAPAAGEEPQGERKTVTALFADIKGSTELMEDLDPEDARAIIDPALKLMIDAVQRYDGYVVQSTGDGIFALFGAPVAHEDHPQRAVHAALRLQESLRAHGAEQAARGQQALIARVGINSGEVVMRTVQTGGRLEYTPVGHVTNLAARMQTLAPSGGIAVGRDTRALVQGYFEMRDLGAAAVKGLAEPVEVYEVTGLGPMRSHFQLSAQRGLTTFVGRESEMAEMRRALELALGGRGQIVAAMAEAGAGKSRLFYEFKAKLPAGCKLLEAYSVSHGKAAAWLPVLEMLRKYFGIADGDDATMRRAKVNAALNALDRSLKDATPYLFGLLGIFESADPLAQMDPQIKRARTLDAIKRIVVRESLNQPLVVIFEDLHWIDGETQALLDLLADSIAAARVLLLVNYRPEYGHGWAIKSYYSQLQLGALAGDNAGAMLAALLGNAAELASLKRQIVERTEGNPFFIEEMVQALFDQGALVRNGTVKVMRSLSQLRLPPTVQGILAARIDRLPREHKELLQTLAVIGRESRLGLVRRIAAHAEPRLEGMLGDLRTSEFVREEPASAEVEYVFKHALTQEVAYNSLLIERRKLLHERAGQAIEAQFAQQLDDHLRELAYHYSHSDNADKAVEYLGRAGQQAIQRSAHADAIGDLTSAISRLRILPDSPERTRRELLLQLALGSATIAINGWAAAEVERAFTRARELSAQLDDPPEFFAVLSGLFSMYYLRGALFTAHELAEQMLRRAQTADDQTLPMYAHVAMGDVSYQMGKLLLGKQHLEKTMSLYDPARHRMLAFRFGVDAGVNSLSYMACLLWLLGYPDQALKRGIESLALARDLLQPQSIALAENFLSRLYLLRREALAVQRSAEALRALSVEHGFVLWSAAATIHGGCAIAALGRNEEGTALLQEGLTAYRATGAALNRAECLCRLAEACLPLGRIEEALSDLTEALAIAEEHNDRINEAEMHRLKGELLLRQNDSNSAESRNCFERAIEIARRQSAKSWELRASTSLARLLASQGRHDEARTMLADIYNWFTEGFDTLDLKEAKTLLDELNSQS
jgi:class 3 adenylate cyclase/predicted ATPase